MSFRRFSLRRRRKRFHPENLILSGLKSRKPKRALRLIAVGILLLLFSAAFPMQGERISGGVTVIDGDTLDMGGTRFRLYGIDAPEKAQICQKGGSDYFCGQEALRALAQAIGDRDVACEEQDVDAYGRVVAICFVGETELNRWMVAQGQALAYQQYSIRYLLDEWQAKKARKGLWRGAFEKPWDYRHGR